MLITTCVRGASLWVLAIAACGADHTPLLLAQSNKPSGADSSAASGSPARWAEDAESISLMRGDELLFRYVFRSGNKPIIYPLLGPSGQAMSRDYPMKEASAGGTTDHIHQRSMWLTHGEVNDIDFWAEGRNAGVIEHQSVDSKNTDREFATLQTTSHWMGTNGKPLLKEQRTTRIGFAGPSRTIELKVDLQAVDQDVNFGDTKEGSFGIRVPDSMAVASKLGGTIINDQGQKDGDAWAQKARWVNYSGPIDGKVAGITIHEHPSSFGHPCRWHVRTYGLFAANPFGVFHFVGGQKTEGHTLKKGELLRLHYLVDLHDGPADPDRTEKQWTKFAKAE
jgi:hypothetical protein